ncbi:hypothetical protein BFN03_19905 [Rhodococcus sp. WMMA185]|uniref:hypothetical protein n=1 Tax=Rhodococcus sp. WMMA185 TaxID=679318 RepID=UPI000878CB25|nr:hypothetical protein [Rhodococcus sp. WMMA185]AOW94191.1 hypothetical protein BFN03_00025 [Rhodococcus sp. WMMA185]AOW95295.1 hypothetical protein BFN03_19905 [Rhodococcus sp. WMMA185]
MRKASVWPAQWPTIPREIAEAVDAAVGAAVSSNVAAFFEATEDLAALPAERVRVVLAAIVREILETMHPDGLTGEDVQEVLAHAVGVARTWMPDVDVASFVAVLTGALGVAEADESDLPTSAVPSAILLIADLVSSAQVSVHDYVRRALDEVARAEIVEMP